ncbi:sigma-70 family RNA polymerase sigma factor [Niameybacter massiliensis]|uniref:Sigma-70 family RNA polymerase sigma factor n=1 Tax=Holtiella tumoricola TaxID=3018743 RepID=A0AA42DNS3_9FIRM|nr:MULTISPECIES: sigma-70 family RNA polymerase sigma factor [Lachnospirales]MDA3732370.1 sigma-70 family RNA polymerase sigma factor [Holtiella tumoricola]
MKGAKDNNYARVEGILYNYPKVKVEIENIKIDIEELNDVVGIKGAGNNKIKPSSATNAFNSNVENEVIDREENLPDRINDMNRLLRNKERYIRKVDNALSLLKEDERKLVELIYFKRYTLEKAGEVFDITKDGMAKRRKPVILELINIL